MSIIQFSGIIDGVQSKKDRTLSIKIGTQELPAEETSKIFEHSGHQLWICLAETQVTREELDIPEVVDDLDKKSPSQRFRDRLYVYYKETKETTEGFDSWYKDTLNTLGQAYLDKLN